MRQSPALVPGPGERAIRASVLAYVTLLVAIPLVTLTAFGLQPGLPEFWRVVSAPVVVAALWLTIWTAGVIAIINAFLGTATAWVLVRYRFPGRSILSAAIDLPLAIPTLVAGMMIVTLYGPTSFIGTTFDAWGMPIVFASPGILLALAFVTLPFIVRAVEPLLEEIDPAQEEAAIVLGAGRWRVFTTVFWPAIAPATISGSIRSLGRALGEFGAMVIVAGNIPMKTLTAPVLIFGEIESGDPRSAAAISLVLLALALVLHLCADWIERRLGDRHG